MDYETYHVQTDFENVNFNSDLGDGWRFDNKLFTYRYWNKEYYQNNGAAIAAVNTSANPSGVDKLNGYRQAGDIVNLSKETKWGVLRVRRLVQLGLYGSLPDSVEPGHAGGYTFR